MFIGVRAAACVVLAVVLLAVAAPAPVQAQSSPPASDSVPSTTTVGVTTTSTTTTSIPATTTTVTTTPPPTTPPPTTVGPAPTTLPGTTTTTTTVPKSTTLPPNPAQLATLIQDLARNVAKAQAVAAYQNAQATAAAQLHVAVPSLPLSPTGGTATSGFGGSDPVLIQVAITQLKATATRAAAQKVFDDIRRRIAQVGVALYLGEQLPDVTDPTSGSAAARSAFMSSILGEELRQVRQANQVLAVADAVFNKTRMDADQLVNARAARLYAAAGIPTGAPPTTTSALAGLQPIAAQRGPALSGGLVAGSPTILGQSVLTTDEVLGWYADSARQPHLTVPIAELIADYQRVGVADGVRWDIAIAQAVVETAYFGFPGYGQVATADNNFAGIGACDSCSHGFQFPDAATGVAAHLQLLHAYATPQPIPGPLAKIPSVAGCCPSWLALTGVWATATSYGFAILNTYQAMVVWALGRRSAAAGL